MNFAVACKAFVVEDGKLLLVKRASDDVHHPNIWELPGGRMGPGENPFEGLRRELKEETGLDIEVKQPLNIQHFTRMDGQVITMIIFLCNKLSGEVNLSHEHANFDWIPLEKAKEKLVDFFHGEVDLFKKLSFL